MNFSIIVAACLPNYGIGINNKLPWKSKEDMEYFKKVTMHKAVVMGRNTYFSIPKKFRPLKDRINIVISSKKELFEKEDDDIWVVDSLKNTFNTLEVCKGILCDEIFIIGGSKLYEEAINDEKCNKVYLTLIEKEFECDTFLSNNFIEVLNEKYNIITETVVKENDYLLKFQIYERKIITLC